MTTSPQNPEPASSKRRRPIWFHIHFWIGWIAALPIIVVCATGAILVFDQQLHHWDHPEQFQLEVTGEPLSVPEALEVYWSANPRIQVNHMGVPQAPEHAYHAYAVEISEDGSRKGIQAIVNPYTGELTKIESKSSLSGWIIDLHRHFAMGKTGQMIIAISSLVLALTCIVGLILWWPMRGRTFVRAWKRGKALDWHNALGLVAMVPLIVMALTGVCFTWGKQIFGFLEKFQDAPASIQIPELVVEDGAEKLPFEVVMARVEELMPPEARMTGVQPSNHKKAPHRFFFDVGSDHIDLIMDPYTGKEHFRIDGSMKAPGPVSWIRRNMAGLHTLGPYGWVARIIWGILSLVGAILAVTGVWISLRRWQRKKRKSVAAA